MLDVLILRQFLFSLFLTATLFCSPTLPLVQILAAVEVKPDIITNIPVTASAKVSAKKKKAPPVIEEAFVNTGYARHRLQGSGVKVVEKSSAVQPPLEVINDVLSQKKIAEKNIEKNIVKNSEVLKSARRKSRNTVYSDDDDFGTADQQTPVKKSLDPTPIMMKENVKQKEREKETERERERVKDKERETEKERGIVEEMEKKKRMKEKKEKEREKEKATEKEKEKEKEREEEKERENKKGKEKGKRGSDRRSTLTKSSVLQDISNTLSISSQSQTSPLTPLPSTTPNAAKSTFLTDKRRRTYGGKVKTPAAAPTDEGESAGVGGSVGNENDTPNPRTPLNTANTARRRSYRAKTPIDPGLEDSTISNTSKSSKLIGGLNTAYAYGRGVSKGSMDTTATAKSGTSQRNATPKVIKVFNDKDRVIDGEKERERKRESNITPHVTAKKARMRTATMSEDDPDDEEKAVLKESKIELEQEQEREVQEEQQDDNNGNSDEHEDYPIDHPEGDRDREDVNDGVADNATSDSPLHSAVTKSTMLIESRNSRSDNRDNNKMIENDTDKEKEKEKEQVVKMKVKTPPKKRGLEDVPIQGKKRKVSPVHDAPLSQGWRPQFSMTSANTSDTRESGVEVALGGSRVMDEDVFEEEEVKKVSRLDASARDRSSIYESTRNEKSGRGERNESSGSMKAETLSQTRTSGSQYVSEQDDVGGSYDSVASSQDTALPDRRRKGREKERSPSNSSDGEEPSSDEDGVIAM